MLFNVKQPPPLTLPSCTSAIRRQANSIDGKIWGKLSFPFDFAFIPSRGMNAPGHSTRAEYLPKKVGVQLVEGSSTLLFPKSLAMAHQALSP